MKRIIIRSDGQNGYVIELMAPGSGRERVDQRALGADIDIARKLAARWSTMNGGCPIEDLTAQ